MDSMKVRDQGFEEVLKDFPQNQVETLIDFHRKNGGLSRYVKFKYFFEEIRGESITQKDINYWASMFSNIMKELLIDKKLLIKETVDFISRESKTKTMHIVSGSDQNELRYLCEKVEIDKYFKSIHGSPTPKNSLVKEILVKEKYDLKTCVLIGDSINDFEAADINGISFMGYNNLDLKDKGIYINSFSC
jgi:HAD superfamily hydrolase (TIGR01549 family)